CRVEAVLLGNLPGLSGPWLTQYAQRLAQVAGPVAILHVDRQRLDLEFVEPTDRPIAPRRAAPGRARGSSGAASAAAQDAPVVEPGGLLAQLRALMTDEDRPLRRLLLHVSPAALAELEGPARWTLLTGADDMALAAAARLLDEAGDAARVQPRQVDVMVMGSDEGVSQEAAQRLRDAAAALIQAPVRLVGHQRQMVPVNLRQLGRFDADAGTLATLRRDLARLDRLGERTQTPERLTEAVDDAPHEPTAAERASGRQRAAAAADIAADEPAGDELVTTDATAEDESLATATATATTTATTTATAPAPAAASPAAVDVADEPNLASLLTTGTGALAGGVPLEARCPHQPATQLVLAPDGCLHLLGRHLASAGPPGSPATINPAAAPAASDDVRDLAQLRTTMLELLGARQWVRDHLALIQLTQRQCRFDAAAEPVLHLFTHRADLANALACRLGPMLKLHLLHNVGTSDAPRWFCTPLN
ncbi:MAG: hypothetical protein WD009_07065, partial [Phycisphaeraceae bacterium]